MVPFNLKKNPPKAYKSQIRSFQYFRKIYNLNHYKFFCKINMMAILLWITAPAFAEITCLKCHSHDNIESLIQQREIHPDYQQLPIPKWAKVTTLGGQLTNINTAASSNAFSEPLVGLNTENLKKHNQGDAFFEQSFIAAPNEKYADFSGLGPVFNDNACESCHQKDGRFGLTPMTPLSDLIKLSDSGIFFRISIEDEKTYQGPWGTVKRSKDNSWGAPTAVPNFSDQLFHRAASRHQFLRKTDNNAKLDHSALQTGQADVWMNVEKVKTITYADGTQVNLTKPILKVDNPYDDPDDASVYNEMDVSEKAKSRLFRPDVHFSPRIGMPIYGLGLLAAIREEDILSQTNRDQSQNNGITGKANWVYDAQKHEICQKLQNCAKNPPISLGRFGWKASEPTVRQQSLKALRGDMGITNSLFEKESIENTDLWKNYLNANPKFKEYIDHKTKPEATKSFEDAVVFYTETLAVPARSPVQDEDIIKGAQLFQAANCDSCHKPSYITGADQELNLLDNQKIYPFTDMLLHDMGPDLADNRRDFDANGSEWKTRPLWGIGKTKTVNPLAGFLHDGRAKTLEEAILWHGGEAEGSKEYFRQLHKKGRAFLIKFLQSL